MKKKYKEYTLNDITSDDIRMLSDAVNKPLKSFYCYGNHWYKLYSLHLVDKDTSVTRYGKDVIKAYHEFYSDNN